MEIKPLYEIFSGSDLAIAEKIQQRRLQILVHSYIYYELDQNIVPDSKWAQWGKELCELQVKYPSIAKQVPYLDGFDDFDASTGAFLPYKTEQIIMIADKLLCDNKPKEITVQQPKKPSEQFTLF